MAEEYRQLTLKERKEIEEGLARGDSFRSIAGLIGRSPSIVSGEVRENRHVKAFKGRKRACRDRNWCKKKLEPWTGENMYKSSKHVATFFIAGFQHYGGCLAHGKLKPDKKLKMVPEVRVGLYVTDRR